MRTIERPSVFKLDCKREAKAFEHRLSEFTHGKTSTSAHAWLTVRNESSQPVSTKSGLAVKELERVRQWAD
jgi:hypothetical protein